MLAPLFLQMAPWIKPAAGKSVATLAKIGVAAVRRPPCSDDAVNKGTGISDS